MSTPAQREDNFRNALGNLGEIGVKAIIETLEGNEPIGVGDWIRRGPNGHPCGCLMLDGYAEKYPMRWALLLSASNSEDGNGCAQTTSSGPSLHDVLVRALAREYDCETFEVNDAASAFDSWARYTLPHSDAGILTKYGRSEARRIARNALERIQ